MTNPHPSRYHWEILQDGFLPLRPDGSVDEAVEHRCTSVLIWPQGTPPAAENTILVDPSFSENGWTQAVQRLDGLGVAPQAIYRVFITHPHNDHMPSLPDSAPSLRFRQVTFTDVGRIDGIEAKQAPGHYPVLLALAFQDTDDRATWVVGDAVLDEEWLRAWNYYWPNGYAPAEVVETWRSVARILSSADLVVPGHGPALPVTPDLLRDLIANFPRAPYADRCPEVRDMLAARLDQLTGEA